MNGSIRGLVGTAASVLLTAVLATIAPAAAAGLGHSPSSVACDVGALGQGGVSSSGRAQGSYHDGPGLVPGVESRTAGTDESGRLELSGVLEGTLSGTFRGDTFNGRTSGIFGECSGNGCAP